MHWQGLENGHLDTTRMICGSWPLPLEEHKALWHPVNTSSILNTLPCKQAVSPTKNAEGTCVLCLTWGVWDQIVPNAEQTTKEPLGTSCRFCSTHHQPHLKACTCSLGAAPGSSRYYGALLWTSTLTATLRFSSSLWLSSYWGCTDLRQYFHWISFLRFLEIPRSALHSGPFLYQRHS